MKFFPFSFLSSFSSFFALIFFYFLLYSPSYNGSGRNNVRLDLYLDKETCDSTCVWTKWLVTWLDLTSDQMTCDLTWTCTEMTCDLTWTCKKWLAGISAFLAPIHTLACGVLYTAFYHFHYAKGFGLICVKLIQMCVKRNNWFIWNLPVSYLSLGGYFLGGYFVFIW